MSTYGQTRISTGGRGIDAFTNPEMVRDKPGGITHDWNASGWPVGDGVTDIGGGVVVPSGVKYARYGMPLTKITASGKYGPALTTANDGRQVVDGFLSGSTFISKRTHLQSSLKSDQCALIADNGDVFTARMFTSYAGAPTLANLRAMFPKIGFID